MSNVLISVQSRKMFRYIVLACLLVAIQGRSLPSAIRRHSHIRSIFPNGRIVGGSQITIDQAPWQVALEDSGFLFCGGSIISGNFILTAAHCTDGSSPKDIKVRCGTDRLETGGQVIAVKAIHQNPDFNQQELDSDVSVMELSSPITLSDSAQAVVLSSTEAVAKEVARVTGWGTTTEGGGTLPNRLRAVNVPIVARGDCNDAYDGAITKYMICAGEEGKDSCQGDSGGAITIDSVQVGIVSWGYGCAEKDYPGVYSNVPGLRDFITKNSNGEAQWS